MVEQTWSTFDQAWLSIIAGMCFQCGMNLTTFLEAGISDSMSEMAWMGWSWFVCDVLDAFCCLHILWHALTPYEFSCKWSRPRILVVLFVTNNSNNVRTCKVFVFTVFNIILLPEREPGQLTATGRHWLSARLRGISRHTFLPQNWALPCAIQFPVSPLNWQGLLDCWKLNLLQMLQYQTGKQKTWSNVLKKFCAIVDFYLPR